MQKFTYNQVVHLNVLLKESSIPYRVHLIDEQTIDVEPLGVCACSGKGELVKDAIRDFCKRENLNITFSEDGRKIVLLKTIRVVAAIIRGTGEHSDCIFATQRGYGEFKGGWEFPGGKIEPTETPKQALVREIQEELNTQIEVGDLVYTVDYNYPQFHLNMECYFCNVLEGNLELLEHESSRWLTKEQLDDVEWLPADIEVIEAIRQYL